MTEGEPQEPNPEKIPSWIDFEELLKIFLDQLKSKEKFAPDIFDFLSSLNNMEIRLVDNPNKKSAFEGEFREYERTAYEHIEAVRDWIFLVTESDNQMQANDRINHLISSLEELVALSHKLAAYELESN